MKKMPLYKLFEGCTNIKYPTDEIYNLEIDASITVNEPEKNSILFITDKISQDNQAFDFSKISNAPCVAIASHNKEILYANCPIIRVGNVREALSYAASNSCDIDYKKIKFIGITGTNGKTTTATLIYKMLMQCGYKVGFIGTGKIISNGVTLSEETYSMTTPDPTLLYTSIERMSKDGCEYIVMEVSSHSIALDKISPITFEYAIFTNLDNDHLDFHGDKEEYFKTKLRLFSKTRQGLFNMDDNYARRAIDLVSCKTSTFGIINEADAYATEVYSDNKSYSSFFYRADNLIFKAKINLIGAFNVYNSLAALKCIIDLGVKACLAKRAIARITEIDGRMQVITGDVNVVIDYAHTPIAFYNCLKTSKQLINPKQKLIVVFGCGGERDKSKRSVFGMHAESLADRIIITEDNSRNESFNDIANDIISGINNKKFEVIQDRASAIRYAFKIANPGDLVAVIGKGHERYKIVGQEYIPFDERKIIIEALNQRVASLCE